MKNQVLLYYKYINIENPEEFMASQRVLCESLNLKGRILIAKEGINGTVEGSVENTEKYIEEMIKDKRFADVQWKKSEGTEDLSAFPKLSIKVRPEIVALKLGEDDFSPAEITGKYVTPDDLYNWLNSDKEFYIIDMRNDYEHKVGYFQNSVLPSLSNFRDLPDMIHQLEKFKDKTVVTVCTGGVRCEKASGYLIKRGFKDVYQLQGGIVSFMEKYPNQYFQGKLYVFDNRTLMGFQVDSPEHKIIGDCDKCGNSSDNYVDCAYIHCKGHRHFVCCEDCLEVDGKAYCSGNCKEMDFKLAAQVQILEVAD